MEITILLILNGLALLTLLLLMQKIRGSLVGSGAILAFALFGDLFKLPFILAGFNSPKFILPGGGILLLLLVAATTYNRKRIIWSRVSVLGLVSLVILFAYSGLTIIWSPSQIYGGEKAAWALFRGVFFGVLAGILTASKRPQLETPWRAIALVSLLFCISLAFFGEQSDLYPGRRILLDQNPIWVSRLCMVGLTLAIFAPKLQITLLVPLFAFSCYGIWQTQTRGTIVAFLIAICIFYLAETKFKKWSLSRNKLAVGATAILGAMIIIVALANYGRFSFEGRLGILVDRDAFVSDENYVDRVKKISEAMSRFYDRPVFGVGLGGFSETGERAYPHNLIVELLLETGLLGSSLFLMFIGFSISASRKDKILFLLIVESFLFSMTSGDLMGNFEVFLFGTYALVVALFRPERLRSNL